MFRFPKLTAGGGPEPINKKNCLDYHSWWVDYWTKCQQDIKEGIKDHEECCKKMVCNQKDEWLKKNGIQPCPKFGGYGGPHFGSIREDNYRDYLYAQKMKLLKIGVL